MAKPKSAQTPLKINEGDFFFIAGRGVVMAHYPERSLGSKFKERKGQGGIKWQGDGKKPVVNKKTLLLVSLAPKGEALYHERKNDDILLPIPTQDELDAAIVTVSQKEVGTELTDELFDKLAATGKLSDLARLGSIANANIHSDENRLTFNSIYRVLATVDFYHGFFAGNPDRRKILTSRNSRKDFNAAFTESSNRLIAHGKATAKKLYDSGKQTVKVEPELSPAEKKRLEKAEKKAARLKKKDGSIRRAKNKRTRNYRPAT